ncbi:MAG TPA: CNNM domain-containing protein [Bdellovibrionota bacterium]|nr:CNNM domain-containing protein [Bdellovibrionota bacterium]
MNSIELLSCLVLVAVSAYMSASEIALFSLSRFQLRSLKETFPSGYRRMKQLLSDPGGLLITILVVNEVMNIWLGTIITGAVSRVRAQSSYADQSLLFFPPWAVDTVLGLLATAPFVLFFGEITPKVIAARANQLIATLAIGPLSFVYSAFAPVRMVLKRLIATVSRWAGDEATAFAHSTEPDGERILKESDFLLMLEEGHKEGAIGQNELDLIKRVFQFDDTTVSSIFTPLSAVQTLPGKTTARSAIQSVRSQMYSRMPITGDDKKKVVGILYAKDLLRAKLQTDLPNVTVDTLMRKPLFVPPTMRLNALFRRFKDQKTHMAVVESPSGDALGVVTMSDVLETLLEDLLPDDEHSGEIMRPKA